MSPFYPKYRVWVVRYGQRIVDFWRLFSAMSEVFFSASPRMFFLRVDAQCKELTGNPPKWQYSVKSMSEIKCPHFGLTNLKKLNVFYKSDIWRDMTSYLILRRFQRGQNRGFGFPSWMGQKKEKLTFTTSEIESWLNFGLETKFWIFLRHLYLPKNWLGKK